MIAIPESLAFYWSEPANRAAVNVLAGRTEVPPDLTPDELERFEVASLASARVRLDLWRLLRALWSASFEEAVRAALPTARLLNFGEHAAFPEADYAPSVERAWAERLIYGVHEVPTHGHLVTCVWLNAAQGDRELELLFYCLDPAGHSSVSDGLAIGADWGERDGWRVTGHRPHVFSDDNTAVDVAPFDALGRSAVSALAEALANRVPSAASPVTKRSPKGRLS